MPPSVARPRISAIRPSWAIPGGRITLEGTDLTPDPVAVPDVTLGDVEAPVVRASAHAITIIVPTNAGGGHTPVRLEGALGETAFVEVGTRVATGVHQVDSPALDADGYLYLTYSGTRGEESPVSLFRVGRNGFREPFVTGITNATSMACGGDGRLYVSSRFDGRVYRIASDGTHEVYASDLGAATGLAFDPDGTLYVGDRSGTVFRVTRGRATPFAAIPASVAAFHLAWGADAALYVTAPTLSTQDAVYRIDPTGEVDTVCTRLGRPQGLAFDSQGSLFVVEALAGESGIYRVGADGTTTRELAGSGLVGLAFDPAGGLIAVTSDTAYRLDVPFRPLVSSPATAG